MSPIRSRLAVFATAVAVFIFLSYVVLPTPPPAPFTSQSTAGPLSTTPRPPPTEAENAVHVSAELLGGNAIMPHLGNETIKAELGNAAWKLLHTTLARFPKKPTVDEREALNSYLHLFARLYPCGECAAHFQLVLRKYPPQTGSRDAASQWGCFVHNLVNDRLRKPLFDCGTVSEAYKCGCSDADADSAADVEGAQAAGAAASAKGTSAGSDESGLPSPPSSPMPPTAAKTAATTMKGSTTETSLEENIRNAPNGARVEIEKGPISMNGG